MQSEVKKARAARVSRLAYLAQRRKKEWIDSAPADRVASRARARETSPINRQRLQRECGKARAPRSITPSV
ncbi:hypothetical protein MHYP_G00318230 [Metynnis hypsauchen]